MNCLPKNTATRRYTVRALCAMSLYVAFLSTAVWLFKHHPPTGAPAYILALLPALPIVAMIIIVGVYLAEEQDEFQRNVLIQSMLWSIGITLAITTVWGFLENFGNTPHLQPFLIFPMFWFIVGVSTPILKVQYR